MQRCVRAKRQGQDDRDERSCEKRRADPKQTAADPSPAAPDGDRRGPEPQRGTRVVREGIAVRVPFLRILRERTREDRVELVVREQRSRLLLHVRPERLRLGVAAERRCPGDRLVEHARERILVGATVHVVAANLLRGEVVEGSSELSGRSRAAVDALRRQAEVAEVAVIGRVDEDVPRLDVAMDEAALVRGVEGICDLADEPDRTLPRKLHVVDEAAEIGSRDESGCEVELPIRLSRCVDREDAGVVDGGGDPRFAQEPLSKGVVTGELGCDELQRDRTIEGELGRPIHDTHPTPADHAFDSIAGELGSYLGHLGIRFSTLGSTM